METRGWLIQYWKEEPGKIADESTASCLEILLAIILPPLGVFFKLGARVEFWISVLLTMFGYIPGIIYAIYAITRPNSSPSTTPPNS